MKKQGYDAAIAYNWMAGPDLPGRAGPAPRERNPGRGEPVPAGDPVNLRFVGHSEGAVVNTQALQFALESELTPELKAAVGHPLDPAPRQ